MYRSGAESVTLSNTLLGMVLDPRTGRPALGAGGGGYSGAPVHAVAVRTVFDVLLPALTALLEAAKDATAFNLDLVKRGFETDLARLRQSARQRAAE